MQGYFLKLLFAILAGSTSINLSALNILQDPVPGGVYLLELPAENVDKTVFFNDKRVRLECTKKHCHAVVGLPLNLKPGQHHLSLKSGETEIARHTLTVNDKAYKESHLTIKNRRKVNPNPEDMQRIRNEAPRKSRAKNIWTETLTGQLPFDGPAEGRLSSPFGLKRFYNGQQRSPHSGMDIAAPRGTPVHAPADGTVTETGDFFFSGNLVFLDHGQGLISYYAHLDSIQVTPGMQIKRGDQIGTIGDTGRVTGPHLHWTVMLNGARINPFNLLDPESRKKYLGTQTQDK